MKRVSKVAFHTLGCKLNYSETATISKQFTESGFETVNFNSAADLYVINTCSVTENADKECRKIVNKAKSIAPDATVAVIGCYAQLKPNEIREIAGVDMVLGASEKFNILDHFNSFDSEIPLVIGCDIRELSEFIPTQSDRNRTRSFIKVQDGCDYSCSFCTIPLARGRSRSDTIENVIERIHSLLSSGTKELVLSGINLGDFKDRSQNRTRDFLDLIRTIDKIDSLERVRISSIEPNLLSDDII
ncbi:MAG: tRNA (N(6)-L-threonylcarbamoyladenosine(37)-C(2))-methylthiotransferase MtaB, partial [Bacteroidia bacterium]|nr:tRNA (N(6)-L-threonylcarbamoyladenosine(37)-C(2))-methylthiotransferase MtaB [Bacteroidia bacterium]